MTMIFNFQVCLESGIGHAFETAFDQFDETIILDNMIGQLLRAVTWFKIGLLIRLYI